MVDPAVVAPDGSPVAIYRALPSTGEPEWIHAAVAAGADLLELGCGTGRVTVELVRLGHRVTAVDQSSAMLATLPADPAIEPVKADIETLDLGRRFPAVIAGSHLLNAESPLADSFVAAARRHVSDDGVVIAEVYPALLDWTASVGRTTIIGPVGVSLVRAVVDGDRLDAAMRYDLGDRHWLQPFTAVLRDDAAVAALLARGGLRLDHWLDPATGWLVARPSAR